MPRPKSLKLLTLQVVACCPFREHLPGRTVEALWELPPRPQASRVSESALFTNWSIVQDLNSLSPTVGLSA